MTDLFQIMKILFKFSIKQEVKSRGYMLALSPSIIKCKDVWIREFIILYYKMILHLIYLPKKTMLKSLRDDKKNRDRM